MFYFHHMSLCQEVPNKAGRVMLDPAFWNEIEGGVDINKFTHALKSTSGHKLENSTEFVVTDASAILALSQIFKYLFFIISEVEYINEMPVNYSDEWDKSLKIDDLVILGWSVYAFSEPAFLYGNYPVKFEGDNIILDKEYINEWGLILNEELARKVAKLNNANNDANSEHWRVIGICVDQNTLSRIRKAAAI
jgi:hypothetical protein